MNGAENHDSEIRMPISEELLRLPDLIGNWNRHIYYHALLCDHALLSHTLAGLLNDCVHANRFSFRETN